MRTWTPKEIKNLRTSYELTQPVFGKMLGVSGNYIYLLEKGVKTPGKSFKLLMDCFEEKLIEKGKGVRKKYGKRHL